MKKRFLSIFLTIAMVISFVPVTGVSAADVELPGGAYTVSDDTNGCIINFSDVYTAGDDTTTYAFADDTVSFTVEPTEGYEVESVSVNDGAVECSENEGSYSFVMPYEPVVVRAVETKIGGEEVTKYAVNVADTKNGTVVPALTEREGGAGLDVTVTPDEGYEVESFVITDENGSEVTYEIFTDGTYHFEMPYCAVTITVTFAKTGGEEPPAGGGGVYQVSADVKTVGGFVHFETVATSGNLIYVAPDEEVTAYVVARDGYKLKTVELNGTEQTDLGEAEEVTIGYQVYTRATTFSFTMPEEDTTVSVEFEKGYLLSYDRNYDSVEGDDPAPVYYLPGETVELIDGSHYYYKEHHTFIGWECDGEFYQVGSLFTMPEKDVTLTARWSENIYTVDVIVKTADGSSAEGIEVRALQNGVLYEHSYENENIVVESEVVTTGSAYLKLPAGVYSVEANVYTQSGALDRNASVVVEVTGEDTVVEVALPGDSVSSGLVFDESDAPEDEDVAAPLAVGGLDKVAAEHGKGEDSHVRAEMNIAPKGKDDVNDDHKKEIERKSRDHGKGGKKQFFSFLDISVGLLVGDSTKAEPLSKTGVVLEIILSYDMEGKDNLNLYRHHNGAVNVFGKLDKRAEKAEDRVDGKVFFDEENGRIYIYTNLFSTYAIGYGVDETDVIPEEDPVVEGGGGGGGYSGPVTIPGKKPEQPKEEEPKDETGSFVDVPAGAYYTEAVAWAVEKGITNGMGDGTFAPNASCTRAQMVTFLYRAAGSPSVAGDVSFSDVSADAYYANAIAWAVANGITNGMGDGTFAPDAECTRAQMATFLYRMQGGAASGESGFADVETGAYYADAVAWAVANGITNGMGDGTFAPNSNCTRGQMVTFLFRCFAE